MNTHRNYAEWHDYLFDLARAAKVGHEVAHASLRVAVALQFAGVPEASQRFPAVDQHGTRAEWKFYVPGVAAVELLIDGVLKPSTLRWVVNTNDVTIGPGTVPLDAPFALPPEVVAMLATMYPRGVTP